MFQTIVGTITQLDEVILRASFDLGQTNLEDKTTVDCFQGVLQKLIQQLPEVQK